MKKAPRIMTRRHFIKSGLRSLAALTAGTCLAPLGRAFASAPGALDMRFLRQIVAGDNMHRRTVMWQSEEECAGVHLLWHEVGSTREHRADATADYFVDDGVPLFLHSSYIRGLMPGKRYEYRIVHEDKTSARYPMKTDDGTHCKAILASDSQCEDGYVTWRRIALGAAIRNPDADFFLLLGDLVDNGEIRQHWDDWFTAMDGIAEKIPLAPLIGNHETYGRGWVIRWPHAYLGYFDLPKNGSANFSRFYYSFDYGPVHFVMLGTLREELEGLKPGLVREQTEWLRRDVRASKKPWTVVCMHRDIYDYDVHPPKFSDTGRRLMPLFEELGIDAVLAGHVHSYRRRNHIFRFRSDAKNGPLYICTGIAGDCRCYDIPPAACDDFIAPQPETNNYMTLEARAHTLSFTCFLGDGVAIDRVLLHK